MTAPVFLRFHTKCLYLCFALNLFIIQTIYADGLNVIVVDGDLVPNATGTIQLTDRPPLIDSSGKIYFLADIPDAGQFGLDSILAGSKRGQLEAIVIDEQVLPAFPPAPLCDTGEQTCQVYLSNSGFYVSAGGEILLQLSRDDGLGAGGFASSAWLVGSENADLAPLISDWEYSCDGTVLDICPFSNTDLPLVTESGLYQIGSLFGTAAFGQVDGLSNFTDPLIGNAAPSIPSVTITQIYAGYVAVDGVDIGGYFSQNDEGEILFVAALSDGSDALYLSSPDANGPYSLLAQTDTSGSVPGIGGDAEFNSLTFNTSAGGTTGRALFNDAGYGLLAGQWINSAESFPRYGVWRINQDASVTLVVSERVDNADPVFNTSEWASTSFSRNFNQFLGLRLAPNGDIYFIAVGHDLNNTSDEVAGLWRAPADGGEIQLLYQQREANNALRPGSAMPGGGVLEVFTGSFITLDEMGNLALSVSVAIDDQIKEALYAEDFNGTLQRIAIVGDSIETGTSEFRTLSDIELVTEPFVSAFSGSFRNNRLVFLATFEDGSRALISTGDVISPPPGPQDGEGSAASFASSGEINDPVNTFNGELFSEVVTDIDLGGPMPLRFQRYYASKLRISFIVGDLGSNWLHNFDTRLYRSGNTMTYVTNKGRVVEFLQESGSGDWIQTNSLDSQYQLIAPAAGDAQLYDPDQNLVFTFDFSSSNQLAGKLIKIEDGKGNLHSLTYDSVSAQLQTVTDNLGRTLTFTYNTDLIPKIVIVSDGTRSVNLAYTDPTDSEYLTRVIDVLGGETLYTYEDTSSVADQALLLSTTRPQGNIPFAQTYFDTTEQFASGRVATQTDSQGNLYSLVYNTPDTIVTDPLGDTRVQTHTDDGELITLTDEMGQSFSLGYDTAGRRDLIEDRLGDTTSYSYDVASSNLSSITSADSSTTSFDYSLRMLDQISWNDLTGITYPNAGGESFVFDAAGNLESHSDPIGNTESYTYNNFGQRLTSVNVAGGVTTNTFNTDATQASRVDPSGNTTLFDYDGLKRLSLITNPDLSTTLFTFDAANRPLTFTDENGSTATFTFDANGNQLTNTNPLGDTTDFSYDGNDRLSTVTDPLGNSHSLDYDEFGRVKSYTNRNGHLSNFAYNLLGRLSSITDPLGNSNTTTYDAEGIISSTTDPLGNTTLFDSNNMGRITQITSPSGNSLNILYDQMGWVSESTDQLDHTTTFSRDLSGLLSGVTLPGNAIATSYARNALGQITDLTDPNGSSWLTSFDNQGRQTASQDPLGNSRTINYDNRNRPTTINFPAALGTMTLDYDLAGNLTQASYTDSTALTYNYDANNSLIDANGITFSYDANQRLSSSNGISVVRDPQGQISSVVLAQGKTVTYGYDAADRLMTVTDWMGGVTSFGYDAAGQLVSVVRPNGVDTSYGYNEDGNLISITEANLSSITLTRDGKGQITNAVQNLPEQPKVVQSNTSQFAFDPASQVDTFTYDSLGRLTSDATRTYDWDLASRLTGYTQGSDIVTFDYDALDNRLSRTQNGVIQQYVWNYALGLPSISVEKEQGADIRYYIHTPAGQLIYSIEAADNSRRDYHYDEMGNTVFLTSENAVIIASYTYTPFGQLLTSTTSVDNAFTWQGQFGVLQEENSGLYYLRARYYDATSRRFISRDPVESIHPLEVNPFQYALSNPMQFVDPLGTESALIKAARDRKIALDNINTADKSLQKSRKEFFTQQRKIRDIQRDLETNLFFSTYDPDDFREALSIGNKLYLQVLEDQRNIEIARKNSFDSVSQLFKAKERDCRGVQRKVESSTKEGLKLLGRFHFIELFAGIFGQGSLSDPDPSLIGDDQVELLLPLSAREAPIKFSASDELSPCIVLT